MPTKKYISIINKGGNNIYIKDSEARDLLDDLTETVAELTGLAYYTDVYIGTGTTSSAVMVAANHHDEVAKSTVFTFSNVASGSYIWIILPTDFVPELQMSSVKIPMTLDGTTTVSDVTYKIWKSDNTYSGNLTVCVL